MIVYTGIRVDNVCSVVVQFNRPGWSEVVSYPLHHINRHSPDGFQWGYGGSGPSDLALAIMTDYFYRQGVAKSLEEANGCYQDFKWTFIQPILEDGWTITGTQIREWIEGRPE